MKIFSSLKKDQREAMFLLQLGTFLEYFDLMLYIHMAVLLNELFFPKTDAHTASLLTAFTFCSTYVLRPFGALLFGYIGDRIGRKPTVILTTIAMSVSCVIMANLPTYAQIGISAAWIMIGCRILQGLSSMGEFIGASIYVMEITKPPLRYPAVSLIACVSRIGATAALLVASLVTSHGFNWRIAFWMGATIALIGATARTRLRETSEFVDMKNKFKKVLDPNEPNFNKALKMLRNTNKNWDEKIPFRTTIACFITECAYAIGFYFTFMHCGIILKNTFGYSAEEIIHQNFIMAIIQMVSYFLFTFMAIRIDAIKIALVRTWIFLPFVLIFPVMLQSKISASTFFWLQAFSSFFILSAVPAFANMYERFPIFKRFTYVSFLYAFSRSAVYVLTSFGLVYLIDIFGEWGNWMLLAPTTMGCLWALMYFDKLSKEKPIDTNFSRY